MYDRMQTLTDMQAWYWRIWPQFNIGIYNVDIETTIQQKIQKYHRGYTGDDN